jgi:uncharacterized protein YxjI
MECSGHLHIQQQIEPLEELTGFETRNQYTIKDHEGSTIGHAAEQSGSFLNTIARLVYTRGRPLEITVTDAQGQPQLSLTKGFHLLFPHYQIQDPEGNVVAQAKTRFNLLKKKIDVLGPEGQLYFTAEAPVIYIAKLGFKILSQGEQQAAITKQWSGVGKELITDADNFHIRYDAIAQNGWRKLLLALAFAIDISFFESAD